MEKIKILWENTIHQWKFLSQKVVDYTDKLWNEKKWEYVTRENNWAVGILVEHVDNNSFIFVEQYRMPVAKRVLELVAGICDKPWVSQTQIAAEEIREEIWYSSNKIDLLLSSPSSAGMTDEISHLYTAEVQWDCLWQQLEESEEIEVLEIEKHKVFEFLEEKQKQWVLVSKWIYAAIALYLFKNSPLALQGILK